MPELQEAEYDRLIEHGPVTYSALEQYPQDAITYCYHFDHIKIREVSEFLQIHRNSGYYKFVYGKFQSLDLPTRDALSRFLGKPIRRLLSPSNVFSEDDYVRFLKWRDEQYKDNMPDSLVAQMLGLSVRRIQMLKRIDQLVPGTKRGTTLAASVRVYKKLHFAKLHKTMCRNAK